MNKATSRASSKPVSLCLSAILYSSLFVQPPALLAQDPQQDVAEAARQERARKAAQQKKTTHVYTNEDLQQSQILTNEDRERAEARKNDPANAPVKPVMPSFDVENSPAPQSLGEIARRYRAEKAQREAEEAARSVSPLFPMNLSVPAFADPVQPVEPPRATGFKAGPPLVAPTASGKAIPWKNSRPVARANRSLKRDPFAPQIVAPSLRATGPGISASTPGPARPALPLRNVAPHAPANRIASPATEPPLSLSAAPRSVQPDIRSSAPRHPSTMSGDPNATPVAPKSRRVDSTLSAPQVVAPSAIASAPLRIVPQKKLAPPSVAPVFVAPSVPKSHVATVTTPSVSFPASKSETAQVVGREFMPPRPLVWSWELAVRPTPPLRRPVSNSPAPTLASPLRSMPPLLAGGAQPVAPSVAPVFEPTTPVMPKSSISRAVAPSVITPISPTAAAVGAHVSPIAPATEHNRNTILVQAGDSLWKLARRRLGRGSRWSEFLAANPGIDPALLQPGSVLVVPAGEAYHPAGTLLVRSGDSLWKLALTYFGKGTAWTCLASANPQLHDVNRLQAGQALNLPTSCSR